MIFDDVHGAKFEFDWTVGIERPPFTTYRYLVLQRPIKVKEAWFVEFGDGTVETVFVLLLPAGKPVSNTR